MCIFNAKVKRVAKTRILVAPSQDRTQQLTVYENLVQLDNSAGSSNAMILPAPLPDPSSQDIQLLDLSSTPDFFKDLELMWPTRESLQETNSIQSLGDLDDSLLAVQKVGGYKVSIAKTLQDLRRINPKVFKVAPDIDQLLSQHYPKGFGFVICSFDASSGEEKHPLGYIHPLDSNLRLFVPTRHEHGKDGKEKAKAHFDHVIWSINTKKDDVSGSTPEETANGWDPDEFMVTQGHSPKDAIQWKKLPNKLKLLLVAEGKENELVFRKNQIYGQKKNEDLLLTALTEEEKKKNLKTVYAAHVKKPAPLRSRK